MQGNTNKFEELISQLSAESELETSATSLESRCRIGLKRLGIAREFAQIDNQILDLSMGNEGNCSVEFLSALLALETKRLKFKEEVSKCLENKTKIS